MNRQALSLQLIIGRYQYIVDMNNKLIKYEKIYNKYQSINSLKAAEAIILLDLLKEINLSMIDN